MRELWNIFNFPFINVTWLCQQLLTTCKMEHFLLRFAYKWNFMVRILIEINAVPRHLKLFISVSTDFFFSFEQFKDVLLVILTDVVLN